MSDEDHQNLIRLMLYLLMMILIPAMILVMVLYAFTVGMEGMVILGKALLCIVGLLGAGWMVNGLVQAYRDGRDIRRIERIESIRRVDPVHAAQLRAHGMLPAVREAMASIEAFRTISADSSLPIVVDAHSLIDARIPAIMEHLAASIEDTTPEEAETLTNQALASVVSIGDVAARARAAIIEERGRMLSIETAYVEKRTAPYRGEGLTSIE